MDCYIRYGSSLQASSHFSSFGAPIVYEEEAIPQLWGGGGFCF